ncbi:MAG: phytoene/squalene synthase family protein [Sandaracinus sp.]
MSAERDLAVCRETLARGSKSFHFAWRLLPARLRDPFAAFYAFCRVTDDLVDESADAAAGLARCVARTDAIFAGRPEDDPVDRAFARIVEQHRLPRAPVDALIDGYRWDVERRVIATRSDLLGYAVRVASSVGVATSYLMGVRDRDTLARAADLGAAMQLTNVARDVGEDARRGRLYLPSEWLREEGVDVAALLGPSPRHTDAIGRVVRRVLDEAEPIYARAESGIAALPADARPAILAAGRIYQEIGQIVRENGYDAVTSRATTSTARKVLVVARSRLETRRAGSLAEPALPEALILLPA